MTAAPSLSSDGDTSSLRAYRLCLDPTRAQVSMLAGHAGAARWAFNYALAVKVAAHQEWRAAVAALVEQGADEAVARKSVKHPIPSKPAIQKLWQAERGDSRADEVGLSPWWHEYSTYAFQSAFADTDFAWKNWLSSLSGLRKGKAVGYPKFKKKGRSRDSFRIHHNVKKPSIRPDGYRRLVVPRIGSIRLHSTSKRLVRELARGSVVQSVTISRQGHRWYAAVLVRTATKLVGVTTKAQRVAGRVGVDLGVSAMAALDTGELVPNPRGARASAKRLTRAQRALSRTQRGSARRRRAARRVGRLHYLLGERRATGLHVLTKRLATGWAEVAVEDLAVASMTASARGTIENPGKRVRQKAGLNREILDVSPGTIRRQLEYKTQWYGSKLAVCDRWFPSSKTCSACGVAKAKLTLADRMFRCDACGLVINRDVNAARNIAKAAIISSSEVASGNGETLNGRGAPEGLGASRRQGHALPARSP
jgi:putative transposase